MRARDAGLLDQHIELYRFFHLNKIYLPSALCGLLNDYEIKAKMSDKTWNFFEPNRIENIRIK